MFTEPPMSPPSSSNSSETSPALAGPEGEKVQNLFSSIAHAYDKANSYMTFGLDKGWRKSLVRWSELKVEDQVLDVACGTGDLAIEFGKALNNTGKVTAVDFCQEMLDQAPAKVKTENLEIDLRWADAQALPFADQEFEVVSIAYGIRNVKSPEIAIREMARVLKPGGRLMILETGEHQSPLMQKAFDLYFKKIMPKIGGYVSGKKEAYEYLSHSSKAFPCREDFVKQLNQAFPFSKIEYKSLMGGASYIYKAIR